jgi:hypothetical protein
MYVPAGIWPGGGRGSDGRELALGSPQLGAAAATLVGGVAAGAGGAAERPWLVVAVHAATDAATITATAKIG